MDENFRFTFSFCSSKSETATESSDRPVSCRVMISLEFRSRCWKYDPCVRTDTPQLHRWLDEPACLMDSSNGLLFLASKHFLRGGFNCFFSQMKNISTLERTSYLISKYSLNLQHLALICMCLTPGLTQFILITIHSLSTVTGYNRHNVLLLICSPLSSSSQQAYTALTLIRSTSRALHFKLFLLSELDLASSDCWKLMESS